MATTAKLEEVELGFLENCDDPEQLASTSFPSKVGGKPLWLDPVLLPPPERLVCGECGQPCVLLLQIYAPLSDDPACYHRSVYVFMCRSPACHKRGSSKPFRVFRCSLPKVNSYYKEEEGEEEEEEEEGSGESSEGKSTHPLTSSAGNNLSNVAVSATCRTDHTPTPITRDHAPTTPIRPPTCLVCGCLGPMHCGKCKKVHYCSRHHQKCDWRAGHKLLCDDLAKGERRGEEIGYQPGGGLLLPVFEIVTETEPEEEEEERSEEERLKDYYKFINSNKYRGTSVATSSCTSDNHLTQAVVGSSVKEDSNFKLFKRRTAREPEQVLRYQRGGEPLLITADPSQKPTNIPPCGHCGADRVFEFQVLPQLLYYLKLDSLMEDSIDWGTLLVYSCSGDCHQPQAPTYLEEVMVKQDL